jgi:hypothetical protein
MILGVVVSDYYLYRGELVLKAFDSQLKLFLYVSPEINTTGKPSIWLSDQLKPGKFMRY